MCAIRLNLAENHKIVLKLFANSYFFTFSIIQTVLHDHFEIFFQGKSRKIIFCLKNHVFSMISFIGKGESHKGGGAKYGFSDKWVPVTQPPMDQMT